jgi:hypothetical protein
LSTRPAATAANGLPPASTTPSAANCAPPANTSSDMVTGTQAACPPDAAIAPKDTPTTPSATQTNAMSRSNTRSITDTPSFVRQSERMSNRMNTATTVRQAERLDFWSER